MRSARLGQHAGRVEQHGVIDTGRVGLELGQDARELVAVVDVLVEHVGEGPTLPGRDQADAVGVVEDRRLVFGQVEERATRLVDPRVEAARVFQAAGHGQPHVQRVVEPIEPGAEHLGPHVLGHVLLIPDRLRERCRTFGDRRGHLPPILRLAGQHVLPARVLEACRRKIGGVEGLVADHAVGPRGKAPQQGGRKIPRAGPDSETAHQADIPREESTAGRTRIPGCHCDAGAGLRLAACHRGRQLPDDQRGLALPLTARPAANCRSAKSANRRQSSARRSCFPDRTW